MPAPARQTPPINPENYTFRFPQDKKWVVQNSCPKVGLSFFGKKGQHFCDSIRSGLRPTLLMDQKKSDRKTFFRDKKISDDVDAASRE